VLDADHGCVPIAVTVETPRGRRERLDAAALFGVVRQSAHRTTQLASFPEPLTQLATVESSKRPLRRIDCREGACCFC
jgi:hypothetical protein